MTGESLIGRCAVPAVAGQEHVDIVGLKGLLGADGVLIVRNAPCAALRQQGVFLDFDAPTLVVGEVPVEAVDLVESHQVDELFHLLDGEEMAGAVEMEASPTEARCVADADEGHVAVMLAEQGKLPKGGNAADDAFVVGSHKLHSFVIDHETIAASLSFLQRQTHIALPASLGCCRQTALLLP